MENTIFSQIRTIELENKVNNEIDRYIFDVNGNDNNCDLQYATYYLFKLNCEHFYRFGRFPFIDVESVDLCKQKLNAKDKLILNEEIRKYTKDVKIWNWTNGGITIKYSDIFDVFFNFYLLGMSQCYVQ